LELVEGKPGSALSQLKVVRWLAIIQAFCGTVFAIDILYEVHLDLVTGIAFDLELVLHLGLETVAVALLFLGYAQTTRLIRHLRIAAGKNEVLLRSLRGQFDDILVTRFKEWELSAAESDVALLSIRGLKIAEIAQMRETRIGTVKAQLSSIFRKSDVSGQNELLGLFMEEFLDFGSAQKPHAL